MWDPSILMMLLTRNLDYFIQSFIIFTKKHNDTPLLFCIWWKGSGLEDNFKIVSHYLPPAFCKLWCDCCTDIMDISVVWDFWRWIFYWFLHLKCCWHGIVLYSNNTSLAVLHYSYINTERDHHDGDTHFWLEYQCWNNLILEFMILYFLI